MTEPMTLNKSKRKKISQRIIKEYLDDCEEDEMRHVAHRAIDFAQCAIAEKNYQTKTAQSFADLSQSFKMEILRLETILKRHGLYDYFAFRNLTPAKCEQPEPPHIDDARIYCGLPKPQDGPKYQALSILAHNHNAWTWLINRPQLKDGKKYRVEFTEVENG